MMLNVPEIFSCFWIHDISLLIYTLSTGKYGIISDRYPFPAPHNNAFCYAPQNVGYSLIKRSKCDKMSGVQDPIVFVILRFKIFFYPKLFVFWVIIIQHRIRGMFSLVILLCKNMSFSVCIFCGVWSGFITPLTHNAI